MALLKLSFSRKLQLYACTVSLLAILLLSLFTFIYQYRQAKSNLVETLQAQAIMLAHSSANNLNRAEIDNVNSYLLYLAQRQQLVGVWIMTTKQELLVNYDPFNIKIPDIDLAAIKAGTSYEAGQVRVVRNVFQNDKDVGKVILIGEMNELLNQTWQGFKPNLYAMFIAFLAAFVLAVWLQKALLKPFVLLSMLIRASPFYKKLDNVETQDDLLSMISIFKLMLKNAHERDQALSQSEERLNLALWGSNQVMFDWDVSSSKWYFDENILNIIGCKIEEIPDTKEAYFKLIHPDEMPLFEKCYRQHLAGKSSEFESLHRLQSQMNEWRWLLARGKVVERNQHGRPVRMAGTLMDITSRKIEQEKLQLFNKVFESTTEGVMVLDPKFSILEVNPAFSKITGFNREEVLGKHIDVLQDDKQNQEYYVRMRYALYMKGLWQGELWEKRKNGEVYLQRLIINAMYNDEGKTMNFVAVFSDITQYKQATEELHYLTHYDSLTNLPNRALFAVQLESAIVRVKKDKKRFAVALIAFDNFKTLNDSFGRKIGDTILQSVAKRLLRCLTKNDLAAHIAFGEFAVIIENSEIIDDYHRILQHVTATLSTNLVVEEYDIMLRPYVGVSLYPDDAKDSQEVLVHASIALYHSKLVGRNAIKFYSSNMNHEIQAKQKMEMLLRSAMAKSELMIYYQPKIDAKTGEIISAEALLRWYNHELGWVDTPDFIAVAEESGLIVPIGKWVLSEVCKQVKVWHKQGFDQFTTSVNLSAQQFRTGDLVREIAKVLIEARLPAKALDLEITESILMDNIERSVLRLKVLKAMGVTVSIDDFGTGYSSLNYLKKFPINTLKIDKTFIHSICYNAEDVSIVKAIIAIAKELNLRTVAEGIETKEQALYLINLDVDELQGFYFSEAVPAEKFTTMLSRNYAKIIMPN